MVESAELRFLFSGQVLDTKKKDNTKTADSSGPVSQTSAGENDQGLSSTDASLLQQELLSQSLLGALQGNSATNADSQSAMQDFQANNGSLLQSPEAYMMLNAPELDGLIAPGDFMKLMMQIKGGKNLDEVTDKDKLQVLKSIQPNLYDNVNELISSRKDIKFADAVDLAKSLPEDLFPTYIKLMKSRGDIAPGDIMKMMQKISLAFQKFGQDAPNLVHQALQTAAAVLEKRQDITPDDMGNLFTAIGEHSNSPGEAFTVMQLSGQLLEKRHDIKPEEVGKLFTTIANGGLDDASTVSAFSQAVDTLGKRSNLKPEDEAQLFLSLRHQTADNQAVLNNFGKANQALQENQELQPADALKKFGPEKSKEEDNKTGQASLPRQGENTGQAAAPQPAGKPTNPHP